MFEYGNIENVEKQVPPRSLGNVAVAETCQRRYFMLEKLVNIFERIKVWVLTLTPAQIASLLILIAALYAARKVVKKGLSVVLTILAVLAGLYFLVPNIFYTVLGWLTSII
jgi:hypothetical protein